MSEHRRDGERGVIVLSLPIIASFLLIAAHFLRASHFLLLGPSLLFPFLLLIRRRWAARTVQLALICAALEWGRTLTELWRERVAFGEPYLRLVLLLVSVIALTLGSALLFHSSAMSRRYRLKT
jgi:hypothetical protein